MPIYDYKCSSCNQSHESFQKITDEPLKSCPYCHQMTLKRQITGQAVFQFKGSGFYCNDYNKPSSSGCACNPNGCCN